MRGVDKELAELLRTCAGAVLGDRDMTEQAHSNVSGYVAATLSSTADQVASYGTGISLNELERGYRQSREALLDYAAKQRAESAKDSLWQMGRSE